MQKSNQAYRMRCSLDKCENCGSRRNHRNVLKYETRDGNDVLIQCSDCPELDDEYCPICGQIHNADSEYNTGYCQNCKNPIMDYSTGEFYHHLK